RMKAAITCSVLSASMTFAGFALKSGKNIVRPLEVITDVLAMKSFSTWRSNPRK
ncbi:ANKIB1 isoform 2, partial [Pongo abelii]